VDILSDHVWAKRGWRIDGLSQSDYGDAAVGVIDVEACVDKD